MDILDIRLCNWIERGDKMFKVIGIVAGAAVLMLLIAFLAGVVLCWKLAGNITKEFAHINGEKER